MGGKPRKLPLTPGVWPMEHHEEYEPKESDGFQRPGPGAKRGGKGHLGSDIMYRRAAKGPENRPTHTPWFFCPNGMKALAVFEGRVCDLGNSPRNGWWVKIEHEGGYMTVYRHLTKVTVLLRQKVEAGQLVGFVGHAPAAGKRGINHLHFEVWDMNRPGPKNSRVAKSIDPKPWLRVWKKL